MWTLCGFILSDSTLPPGLELVGQLCSTYEFEFFRVAVLFTERTATEHLLALPEPAVSSEA